MRDHDIDRLIDEIRGPVRPEPRFEEDLLLRIEDHLAGASPPEPHGPVDLVVFSDTNTPSRARRRAGLGFLAAAAAVMVAVLLLGRGPSSELDVGPASNPPTTGEVSTTSGSPTTTAVAPPAIDIGAIETACRDHWADVVTAAATDDIDATVEAVDDWTNALAGALPAPSPDLSDADLLDDFATLALLADRYADNLANNDRQELMTLNAFTHRAEALARQLTDAGATACAID